LDPKLDTIQQEWDDDHDDNELNFWISFEDEKEGRDEIIDFIRYQIKDQESEEFPA
jgi:hypothetical protein